MSILKNLKLSTETRAKAIASPEVRRREKLLTNIEHQIKAAEASLKGELYTYPAMRNMKHVETGERVRREVQVTVRPWWWKDMADTHFLIIKYGHKKLELQAGKPSIEVGAADNLIPTLQRLAEAVKTGELDEHIAVLATRPGSLAGQKVPAAQAISKAKK